MSTDAQPALPGIVDSRPLELTVTGAELGATIAGIEAQGGRVESFERVTKCSGSWRLRIFWPRHRYQ